uniref:Uncharacterized protein n=1 Tax=Oryza sativa subsp. japonica TaxID=39947 RepID=Q6ZLA6_ORYSJ|nr:hypothetical protein [Oryza sativa Japonica Group]
MSGHGCADCWVMPCRIGTLCQGRGPAAQARSNSRQTSAAMHALLASRVAPPTHTSPPPPFQLTPSVPSPQGERTSSGRSTMAGGPG